MAGAKGRGGTSFGALFPVAAIASFALAPIAWAFFHGPVAEGRLLLLTLAAGLLILAYGVPKWRAQERRSTAAWVVLNSAANDAFRHDHALVTPDHLLAVLLVVPEAASALEARGVRVAALADALEQRLSGLDRRKPEQKTEMSPELTALVRRAVRAAERRGDAVRDASRSVFAALLREVISRRGTPTHELLLSHGLEVGQADTLEALIEDAVATSGSSVAQIVFWSDETTTMDSVVEILTDVFPMSERRAIYLMLTVHKKGSTVVWSCTQTEASKLAERCMAVAREKGVPLRVTVKSPDSKEPAA
jgi:ATP-dependent Clp protease adapter protein ClpS